MRVSSPSPSAGGWTAAAAPQGTVAQFTTRVTLHDPAVPDPLSYASIEAEVSDRFSESATTPE